MPQRNTGWSWSSPECSFTNGSRRVAILGSSWLLLHCYLAGLFGQWMEKYSNVSCADFSSFQHLLSIGLLLWIHDQTEEFGWKGEVRAGKSWGLHIYFLCKQGSHGQPNQSIEPASQENLQKIVHVKSMSTPMYRYGTTNLCNMWSALKLQMLFGIATVWVLQLLLEWLQQRIGGAAYTSHCSACSTYHFPHYLAIMLS